MIGTMDDRIQETLKQRYTAAMNSFIDKIRDDPNVIAAIVSGSLAYDVVWEKSDIDMTLVVRDQTLKQDSYCIVEDGIVINVHLMLRSIFRRGMERNIGGSFSQSYFSKGTMVYTTDDSLIEFFEELKVVGSDDIAVSALHIASELVHLYEKAQKWLTARKDPLYAQYYLLKAAECIAYMELCLRGEAISREVIQRVLREQPELLAPFYQDAMSRHYTAEEIEQAIRRIDGYLERHLDIIKRPVLEFMSDQEIKTITLISKHFRTRGEFIVGIMDYLTEKGVIERVSQTIRITPKSKQAVEEIGYLYIP
ncbi:nucleotidyltransferase [Paenibacillus sp. M1]|uniref:Nucleotidyltransferase n=1 Tax=Paenibacillus haidiansis TaxID=1574488 RepID=A0ABU7VM19_9BACL